MIDKIKHILSGGQLKDEEGGLYSFGNINLEDRDGGLMSFENLDNFEIYFNADQIEIQRLQAIIAMQSEEINKLVLQNKKTRKKSQRLSDGDKRDIEEFVISKKGNLSTEDIRALCTTYNNSESNMYKLVSIYRKAYENTDTTIQIKGK